MNFNNTSNNGSIYKMTAPTPYGISTGPSQSSGGLKGVLLVHLEPVSETNETNDCIKLMGIYSESPVSRPETIMGLEGFGSNADETDLEEDLREYKDLVLRKVTAALNDPASGSSLAGIFPCLQKNTEEDSGLEGKCWPSSRDAVTRTNEAMDIYERIANKNLRDSNYEGRIRFQMARELDTFTAAKGKLRVIESELSVVESE